MAYTYDEQILSDLHKDARGFRPYAGFWQHWNESNQDQKQAIWDDLLVELEAEAQREKAAELSAKAAWEADIQRLIEIGAGDRATAIRWDMEALDARHGDRLDAGYYCYLRGIAYSNENEIKRLMAA